MAALPSIEVHVKPVVDPVTLEALADALAPLVAKRLVEMQRARA